MLLSEGGVWKHQRSHAQPKFTAKSLDKQVDWITALAADFLDTWDSYAKEDMTVIISSYVTHRLPEYWDDPHTFDPSRFDKQRTVGRSRFTYIPFAAGHRNCIGSYMALMQSKLVVALIAQRYSLGLCDGHNVEKHAATTMRPKYGMKMNVQRLAA